MSTPKTTTVRLRPHERRLVEAAARTRDVGPSTYLRIAALEMARRDLVSGPQHPVGSEVWVDIDGRLDQVLAP